MSIRSGMRCFQQAHKWITVRSLAVIFVFSACACACGCATTVSSDWQARLSSCPTSEELGQLMPWDKLEIRVFGQSDLSGEYEVSPRGTISFPRLGEINVAGKRCDEIEVIIREGLQADYLRDPSVTCINREVSKTAVTVDGMVQNPGIVEFRPGLMLTDVIAQSGGPAVRARTDAVVIVRKHDGVSESVTVPYQDILLGKEPNVCMHPADLVYVPQSVF